VTTPSAALVVVGSEVLSAKITDENGPWLARRLRELGVRLASVSVIPDALDEIAATVARERPRVTWLFTSGGVGPTHDDVTVPGVARALGRRVTRQAAFADALRALHRAHHAGEEPPEAALRMADLPEGTRLLGDPSFPTLAVENVVMLPGVPRFFRWQFDRIAHLLAAPPFRLACVYVTLGEEQFAPGLDAVARAHPDVEIGSYPRFDEADHRVKLTLESKDAGKVEAALRAVLEILPAAAIVRTEGP
jgi:molybdenum cofactor synthesis domain-containing protein